MSEDEARAALKKCMQADGEDPDKEFDDEPDAEADDEPDAEADDEPDAEADDEPEAKAKAKSAKKTGIKAGAAKQGKGVAARIKARKAEANEVRRIGKIRATGIKFSNLDKCKLQDGRTVDLIPHAIEHGWTAERTELAATLHDLRSARPGAGVGVGPHLHVPSDVEVTEGMLAAAVMQSARHQFKLEDESFYLDDQTGARRIPESVERQTRRDLKASYTEKEQDHAHRAYGGRIGLQKLIVACARANGYRGSDRIDDSNGPEALRFAAGRYGPPGMIRAEGTSTASLSNVTANVQNKFLLMGYLTIEQAWREIAGIRPVNDFKPTKSVNLLGDMQVQPVPASGELQNAVLDDQAFANQADQYGRILTINRKNIINDDLGALTTAPLLLGRGAGLGLNRLFWGVFLNPGLGDDGNTFYTASRSAPVDPLQTKANPNYATGGTTPLSSSSLQTAKLLFDNQIDPFGYPIVIEDGKPALVFPPDLWITAMELVDPSAIGLVYGGGSAAKQPNVNMWKGRLKPVMSRYLNKTFTYPVGPLGTGGTATATGSTTAWYVLNPALPVIEVAFLQGVDTPTVQMASPDFQFDRLGMSMRVIFDFGVNPQNFRGGVKMAGA